MAKIVDGPTIQIVEFARISAAPHHGWDCLEKETFCAKHLTPPQQIALYDWLSTKGSEAQVVSMTASQMLPLVQAGQFLEGLFYRLNTISTVAANA